MNTDFTTETRRHGDVTKYLYFSPCLSVSVVNDLFENGG